MNTPRSILLIATEDRKELLENIQKQLQTLLSEQIIETELVPYNYFKDGSPNIKIQTSLSGKSTYIISDVYSDAPNNENYVSSINDRYLYSRMIQRIAHTFGGSTVNAIYPAFPYARDDKLDHMGCADHMERKPNAASMVIHDALSSGLNYLITNDIHNLATISAPIMNIQKNLFINQLCDILIETIGYTNKKQLEQQNRFSKSLSGIKHSLLIYLFNKLINKNNEFKIENSRFVSLGYGWIIEEVIKRQGLNKANTVLSGTDEGSLRKIIAACKNLKLGNLITIKEKDYSQAQAVSNIQVYGDCTDKDVLLYDDILDTGGTLITCLKEIWNKIGKPRSVNLLISHGLFNDNSLQQLLEAHKAGLFNILYITNSVLRTKIETFFAENNYTSFIEIIDTSTNITHSIHSIEKKTSINYNNNTPIF